MILHVPRMAIKQIDYRRNFDGYDSYTLSGEAMPLRDRHELTMEFSSSQVNPEVWNKLFGPVSRPYVGVTINTEMEREPSLTDMRWQRLEFSMQYEYARALADFGRVLNAWESPQEN